MRTKLSSKGQMGLPSPLRRKYSIKTSKITWMPMISTEGKGPKITGEMISEILLIFHKISARCQ